MITDHKEDYAKYMTFVCDMCYCEVDIFSDNLKEAVRDLEDEYRWVVTFDEDLKDFYAYCPDCL